MTRDESIPMPAGVLAGIILVSILLLEIVYGRHATRNAENQTKLESKLHLLNEQLENKIAEHQQIEEELITASAMANDMATKAVLANISKSQFLASMSHEIRTPMNCIIGFSDILSMEELTAEQQDYVKTIGDSGKHLLNLINDILDFSKIEAGKHKIEVMDYSLSELLRNIRSLSSLSAAEKNISFKINLSDGLPEQIQTDPTRLTQCLINLTNNAIKFTEKGHVHVNVSLQEDPERSLIRFDVEDTGIGVPGNRREAIFDAFVQADGSTTRKYGGTGLGLAITKRLAELMGGSLTLTSKEGKGSTFSLTLPTNLTEAAAADAEQQFVST